MPRELFGTDGIRGVAGEYPLNRDVAFALGAALGGWAKENSPHPEVLIGMDTRESGPWLAEMVAGGLASLGVAARFAGLITTPGVAYLTRRDDFVAGVMISASHNPYQDNGLKVFDHSGYKLPDDTEDLLEQKIFATLRASRSPSSVQLGVDGGLDRQYTDYLASTLPGGLEGLNLVIDAANGAASHLAHDLFSRLGAKVETTGCEPNGRNINLDCGALHVEGLRQRVLSAGADAGVAFDGDADRAMFVASSGKVVDGDHVLLVAGRALLDEGRLTGPNGEPVVVATVMSNLGLEVALRRHGVRLLRTPVGDKYVLEEMLRSNAAIGGEQSGHVIFRDFATTGDGMLTALRLLEIVKRSGRPLDELTGELKIFPQRLVNVRVKSKRPLAELAAVTKQIRAAEAVFGDSGRILVRFSGTEPLARVMVEGPEEAAVSEHAARIAGAIRAELG
ncbi:MAG: phosphoglucosamine mutase [Bryobacterales bacterium]|nr:phosphoglucosamine mutase [Bryobacterales bacterium]